MLVGSFITSPHDRTYFKHFSKIVLSGYTMFSSTVLTPLLSLLPILTRAVSVSLGYGRNTSPTHDRVGIQTCRNLRPGRCCQGRPIPPDAVNPFYVPPPHEDYHVAQWTGLGPLHIAAVWQASASGEGGCSGTPLATIAGPGNWRYPRAESESPPIIITGASYIKLPTGQPEDKDAPWLEAEGILGLVTGGGEWVSTKASNPVREQILNWRALVYGISRKRKRGVLGGEKGLVVSRSPPKLNSVWVDLIVYDEVEYAQESEGSSVYRSQDGKELEF